MATSELSVGLCSLMAQDMIFQATHDGIPVIPHYWKACDTARGLTARYTIIDCLVVTAHLHSQTCLTSYDLEPIQTEEYPLPYCIQGCHVVGQRELRCIPASAS